MLSFLVLRVSVKLNNQSTKCACDNPCNSEESLQYIGNNSQITILDNQISTLEELNDFHNYFKKVSHNLTEINCNGIIIDGAKWAKKNSPAFLYHDNVSNFSFGNCTFINFNSPIFSIRRSINTTFFDISIINCSTEKEIGLLQFAISHLTLYHFIISNCTANKCAIILISSCNLYYYQSKFTNNCIVHDLKTPLIYGLNSIIEFEDSYINDNFSPNCSLFASDFIGHIAFTNTTFYNNNHISLLSLDSSYTTLEIANSSFLSNKGTILNSPSVSDIEINNTILLDNNAFDNSLIIAQKSYFKIINLTTQNNNGKFFFKFVSKTKCIINNYTSIDDSALTMIYAKNSEKLWMFNSYFYDTTTESSLIHSQNTRLKVDSVNFSQPSKTVIEVENTTATILSSNFFFNLSSIKNTWSTVKVANSTLMIRSSTFHDFHSLTESNSIVYIENCTFLQEKRIAIGNRMKCINCSYGNNSNSIILFVMITSNIIYFAFFVISNSILKILNSIKKHKNERKNTKRKKKGKHRRNSNTSDSDLLPISTSLMNHRKKKIYHLLLL